MFSKLALTIDAGVARIRMDDGKVNAMSPDMLGEIGRALDEADAARAVVVLQGRDGNFSAGFDLRVFQQGPDESRRMVYMGAMLIKRFLSFPHPILTVCAGHAYPMGAFLMLSADSRIGTAGPWRIGMNETAIGLTVPLFAVELARHRLAAPGFASVNAATLYAPEDAVRVGYLDRAVDAAQLESSVETEIARLKTLDRSAFAGTKARVNEAAIRAISAAIETELGEPASAGR